MSQPETLFISRWGTRMTESHLYLLWCLQSLRINFPDEVCLTGSIKIIPSFHNVDQTVVCELRNGVRQIWECPVQREISYRFIRAAEAVLAFNCAKQKSPQQCGLWTAAGSRSWVCLSPAVPSSGRSHTAWVERVEKRRRWTSTPLAWARLRTCMQLVLNTQMGIQVQSCCQL